MNQPSRAGTSIMCSYVSDRVFYHGKQTQALAPRFGSCDIGGARHLATGQLTSTPIV